MNTFRQTGSTDICYFQGHGNRRVHLCLVGCQRQDAYDSVRQGLVNHHRVARSRFEARALGGEDDVMAVIRYIVPLRADGDGRTLIAFQNSDRTREGQALGMIHTQGYCHRCIGRRITRHGHRCGVLFAFQKHCVADRERQRRYVVVNNGNHLLVIAALFRTGSIHTCRQTDLIITFCLDVIADTQRNDGFRLTDSKPIGLSLRIIDS